MEESPEKPKIVVILFLSPLGWGPGGQPPFLIIFDEIRLFFDCIWYHLYCSAVLTNYDNSNFSSYPFGSLFYFIYL